MRIKIFILSTILITLISGVLFYRNLTQISVGKNTIKLDIDELRSIDMQITNSAYALRTNLNTDFSEIQSQIERLKELQALITDINRSSPELKISVDSIREHFKKKQKTLGEFQEAAKEVRTNLSSMLPTYNEMEKKNIKFVLDKRDFYRECLLDTYMFIAFSSKDNENRILEDLKVLSQIINFSTTPNVEVQKLSKQMDVIHIRTNQMNDIIRGLREDSIQNEVKVISKYYLDNLQDQSKQNENLLTFVIVAIGIYFIFLVFFLRKS